MDLYNGLGPGVRCCFWHNLSFDLSLHKSCLNFLLKLKKNRLKSETVPHPILIIVLSYNTVPTLIIVLLIDNDTAPTHIIGLDNGFADILIIHLFHDHPVHIPATGLDTGWCLLDCKS